MPHHPHSKGASTLTRRLFTTAAGVMLTSWSGIQAADLITPEEFESDGDNGARYLSSAFNDGADFFNRHDYAAQNPHPQHLDQPLLGLGGANHTNWAWAMEDITDSNNPHAVVDNSRAFLRLKEITTTGQSNIQITLSTAAIFNTVGNNDLFSTGDGLIIQYAFDGDIPANSTTPPAEPVLRLGNYTTIAQFMGTGVLGQAPRLDTNFDGVGDGTSLSNSLQDFTFTIPGSGNLLSVQIVAVGLGGSEEFVFDNIRVTGDVAVTSPPVLADIEGSAADFTEGGAATQVTNSLTVADSDSTITSATVQIIANNQPTEDVLSVNGLLPGGITATPYVPATGLLTLTGSASAADYQAALRQVEFSNTSSNPSATLIRTIRFQVNDASDASNFQSRNLGVTAIIAGPLAIPYTESFTVDGDGLTYTSNSFTDGQATPQDYFLRTDANPHPGHGVPYIFEAPQGGGYFVSEDVNNAGTNPLGANQPGIVRLADLDASGENNLKVTVYLADNDNGMNPNIGTTERIEVQVAFDASAGGTNLTAGSYTTIGRFVGNGNGAMQQDTNNDGSSSDPADAASPILTSTFTPYTFDVPGSGNILSVQVVITGTGGSDELAFDEITVEANAGDPPVLADLESTPLQLVEGDAPLQLTATVTITDEDSTDLEGATIQITSGFQTGEDLLAISSPLPAGITALAFNPADGKLVLEGTAPLSDYQDALRLITYENTSATNPTICDRTVSFEVTDGSNESDLVTRLIEFTGLVAPGTIPYLETFDTDGDGERYTSNSFTDGNAIPQDFFERTDDNPHPGHVLSGGFTFTNPQGSGYWASEDIEDAGNKLGNQGIVRLPDLDASGLSDLQVSLYLGALGDAFEPGDQIEIQYALDDDTGGTDLTAGTYTTIGRFTGSATDTALRQDTDLDGLSSDPEDTASPVLTSTMTEYTFDVGTTGSILSVQIKITQNGGTEEIGFDQISVNGSDLDPPVADLINPANGSTLTTGVLNALGYLEVTFTEGRELDTATILDAGGEIALSGAGVGTAILSGTPVLVSDSTYRFSFSGEFAPGPVAVEFIAGSFADTAGNSNESETENFTLEGNPPIVGSDTIERHPTQSVKVAEALLLSNDSSPDGNDPLTITAVTYTGGNGATVTRNGGLIFYSPNGHNGIDTFEYTVQDSTGLTSTGTVTVNLQINNDPAQNIVSFNILGNGSARTVFAGIPGRTYSIQTSSDMLVWNTQTTVIADAQGRLEFIDPSPLPPNRFYRTVQP